MSVEDQAVHVQNLQSEVKRQQEAIARLTAALTAAQFDRDEAVKDFRFGVHHDCRPNRKQAESWRDQLRDETDRHADTKAALADRDATIARLREAQAWQPIETAPKDGTFVLVSGDSGYVSTPRYVEVGRFIPAYRDYFVDISGDSFTDAWPEHPTHWMPLPPPPAKEADRG
jgi:hypothetical protein